ncbi:MAG: hypothetical protein AAFR84_00880 [Pseudomonadota bacterium]
MRGKRPGENDRAARRGKGIREFWSRRPLPYAMSNPENKRRARRIERQQARAELHNEEPS